MTDNALVITEQPHALSAYKNRDDVRELGDRLMAMHPAAAEVGPAGMRAAAQLALMLGANPLPGVNEVHIWKDNKARTCMSLGINYWRRKRDEWGGVVYEIQPRAIRSNEAQELGIPNGIMAAICRGVRTTDMIRFKQMGFTTNEIWSMCGATGIGTVGGNEYAKQGRPLLWTAFKRAETDMLRQLFPAQFAQLDQHALTTDAPIMVNPDEDVIEGELTEGGEMGETGDAPGVERKLYTLADANRDLFGDDRPQQPRPAAEDEQWQEEPAAPATSNGQQPPERPEPFVGPQGEATDIDPLAADIMALSQSNIAFSSAAGVTKFIATLTADAPRRDNDILTAADKLICARADGVKGKAAVDAAVAWYKTAVTEEQEAAAQADLFGDGDPAAKQAALATAQGQLD